MALDILDHSKLAAAIKERGLTQGRFAARIGIDQATLSRVLHGRPVSAVVLARIAQGLEDVQPVRDLELVS